MLQTIEAVNSAVNNFIWGVPAMICIIGVGLYLSIRTRFLQSCKFPYAIKTTIGRVFRKREASDGAMTPFQAVCTALAATVGTGNIARSCRCDRNRPVQVPYSGCGFLLPLACALNFQKLPLQFTSVKPTHGEN